MQQNERFIHPSFPQPQDENSLVWRYLTFDKFKWLAEESRLYMPSLLDFEDQLEGRSPNGQKNWWIEAADSQQDPDSKKIVLDNFTKIEGFAESFRRKYFVSCWHLNDLESPEMWRRYANLPSCVAIQTSYKKLAALLPEYLYIGVVRYINYEKDRLPETFNLFDYVMHKDANQFGFESEVRVLGFPPIEAFQNDHKHFMSNLFHKDAGKDALVFAPSIQLSVLLDDVIIHPHSSLEDQNVIIDLCEKHKLPVPKISKCNL